MGAMNAPCVLPEPQSAASLEALPSLRLMAVEALIAALDECLEGAGPLEPDPLADFSLRHLAKAVGTARAAAALIRAAAWSDACILIRALFEQLFAYLWVVQDPGRAETRRAMVTLKQEWANAKYLEGLARVAAPAEREALLAEAERYREAAQALLTSLASALGRSEKQVRDEATLRVSAKAFEVSLDPRFSVPYAYYSGFVHTDGSALEAFGSRTPEGLCYGSRGRAPVHLPLAGDLHRVLLRLAADTLARAPELGGAPQRDAQLAAHADWLEAADARERALGGSPLGFGEAAQLAR